MLDQRARGLQSLLSLGKTLLLPLWMLAAVAFSVELVGRMEYSQVAFNIYLPVAALAGLVAWRGPLGRRGVPARQHWLTAVRQTNREITILSLLLFGAVYATKDQAMSRQFIAYYLISTWGLLLLINRFGPTLGAKHLFPGPSTINALLVGSAARAQELRSQWDQADALGLNLVGLVSYQEEVIKPERLPLLGTYEELHRILREQQVQQVILLETRRSPRFVREVVDTCTREGARLLIYNSWEEYLSQPLRVVEHGGMTFFTFEDEPLQSPLNRMAKRLLDIAVALPVCLLVLPPLALLIKVMQTLQAPGPLIYRQRRTGAEKRDFTIYKFRSLRVESQGDAARQVTRGDGRVYPFGRFLRRTSLDEFPQFWNVLRGQMSVVGPRPHLIQHDEHFARQIELYRSRHFAKPGITGLAQQRGYRGEITKPEDIEARIRLDLEYIYHWSIWLDLGIIFKTFAQILVPPKSAQ